MNDHARREEAMSLRLGATVGAVVASLLLVACDGSGTTHQTSVFLVKPGQCFTTPTTVKVQLSSLTEIACTRPHTQEAYALVTYAGQGTAPAGSVSAAGPSLGSTYPGADVLAGFAQGNCAQRYRGYVGVDYLDSSLYFTYLLPSARSWEQADDRKVICFITTTGSSLDASVKGSKR